MEESVKYCYTSCKSFRCGQHAINIQGPNSYCKWTGDKCIGSMCNYALCIDRKMLPNGVCGFSIRRKTEEKVLSKSEEDDKIKIKVRALKKLRTDDLF